MSTPQPLLLLFTGICGTRYYLNEVRCLFPAVPSVQGVLPADGWSQPNASTGHAQQYRPCSIPAEEREWEGGCICVLWGVLW